MAQDPEAGESSPEPGNGGGIDTSHDLDMVSIYDSSTFDSEVEAGVLKSLLEANGIPAIVVGSEFPNLGYQIQVPRRFLEEARHAIEESAAAGPAGAAEAESQTENGE